MKKDKI